MYFPTIISTLLFASASSAEYLGPLEVVSWNVEAAIQGKGLLPWATLMCNTVPILCRKPHAIKVLKGFASNTKSKVPVISLQGISASQVGEVMRRLGGDWNIAGKPLSESNGVTDFNPILFRPERYTLLEENMHWLISFPPNSKGDTPRLFDTKGQITIAAFRDIKTNLKFIVANTQLSESYPGAHAIELQAASSYIEEMRKKHGPNVILTGSFHEHAHSSLYKQLPDYMKDTWTPSIYATFDGVSENESSEKPTGRTDSIWSNSGVVIGQNYIFPHKTTRRDMKGAFGMTISSHQLVDVEFEIKSPMSVLGVPEDDWENVEHSQILEGPDLEELLRDDLDEDEKIKNLDEYMDEWLDTFHEVD